MKRHRKLTLNLVLVAIFILPGTIDASKGAMRRSSPDSMPKRYPHAGLMRDISESYDRLRAAQAEAAKAAAEAKAAQAAPREPKPEEEEAPSNLPTSILISDSETIARMSPTTKSTRRGVIKQGARIPVFEELPFGNGCADRWLRVMDDGWVCSTDITLSGKSPEAPAYPIVPEGAITPWPYGFVREDTVEYRWVDGSLEEVRSVLKGFGFGIDSTTKVGEDGYFKTAEGTLIPRADAGMTSNISTFEGMALKEGKPFPLGFVRTRNAYAYNAPERSKKTRLGSVDRYKPFEILETQGGGKKRFYKFDEGGWLSAMDVRIAESSPLPKGIAPGEKWIDVDTNAQIITAYEGETPVYVTMISSGRAGSPTVKGEYRIWAKVAAIAMDNTDEQEEEEEPAEAATPTAETAPTAGTEEEPHLYSLHDVPWTQFFHESYALHGVYWHNAFGNKRSHGCVNLAPKDAAWFYNWTEPKIPDGFWAVYSTKDHPGTLVRVR